MPLTLHLRIDRYDEKKDAFDRACKQASGCSTRPVSCGQMLKAMSFSALNIHIYTLSAGEYRVSAGELKVSRQVGLPCNPRARRPKLKNGLPLFLAAFSRLLSCRHGGATSFLLLLRVHGPCRSLRSSHLSWVCRACLFYSSRVISSTRSAPPDLATVKDFLRFKAAAGKGMIVEQTTCDSLNTFAEWFFAGFTRVTDTEINKEDRSEVYDVSIFYHLMARPDLILTSGSEKSCLKKASSPISRGQSIILPNAMFVACYEPHGRGHAVHRRFDGGDFIGYR